MRGMDVDQELSPQPVSSRKHQFSLATLLILLLGLSPAFMSIREASNVATNRGREWGFGIVIFGFAYPLVLTVISYFRLRTAGARNLVRPLYWCTARGAFFGVMYYLLLGLPVLIAEEIVIFRYTGWETHLLHAAVWIAGSLVVGACFGASVGYVVGLVVKSNLPLRQPALEGETTEMQLANQPESGPPS